MAFPAQIVTRFRYVFFAAVLVLLALSLASMAVGIFRGVSVILNTAEMVPGVGSHFLSYFIRAAFLYFLAVAFYTLFLGDLPVPQWMVVRNLFQLKVKVLTFVAIIAALNFLLILAERGRGPKELLYSGGGIFLVLAGIFLLTRMGSPSGDEALSREGNRPSGAAADRDRRRERRDRKPPERKGGEDRAWLDKQKDSLRFEKESLLRAGSEKDQGKSTERVSGHVTVKPGPKRPRRRPRGGKESDR